MRLCRDVRSKKLRTANPVAEPWSVCFFSSCPPKAIRRDSCDRAGDAIEVVAGARAKRRRNTNPAKIPNSHPRSIFQKVRKISHHFMVLGPHPPASAPPSQSLRRSLSLSLSLSLPLASPRRLAHCHSILTVSVSNFLFFGFCWWVSPRCGCRIGEGRPVGRPAPILRPQRGDALPIRRCWAPSISPRTSCPSLAYLPGFRFLIFCSELFGPP